ncbi:IS630 family transposase [Myxococcota bacterium]
MAMRPNGSKKKLEERRRMAVALKRRGLSNREVARVIGCVPASVSRWNKMFETRGPAGLSPKPQAGSKPRLSPNQKRRLGRYLARGPMAFGWRTELWTLSRVAKLIENQFGVRYHISHVHRLLNDLEFSPQKPARRAREQDQEAVAAFRRERWPAIKKRPVAKRGQ